VDFNWLSTDLTDELGDKEVAVRGRRMEVVIANVTETKFQEFVR